MEEKKTQRANLENERPIFLLMGFVVVLSLLFVTFEWKNEQEEYYDPSLLSNLLIEDAFDMEFELPDTDDFSGEMDEIPEEEPQSVEYEGFEVEDELQVQKDLSNEFVNSQEKLQEQNEESRTSEEYPETKPEEILTTDIDTFPEFPGGRSALIRYIHSNLEYPSAAQKQRIKGKVVCSFIVNEDGSVSDIKLEKSVYVFLDDEALRVLRTMPKWKPGKKAGKSVKVKCYVPVVFELRA